MAGSFGSTAAISKVVSITPSDTTDQTGGPFRGFHVNGNGAVAFTDLNGNTNTLTVVAGVPLPYSFTRILSTGTTATGIFGLL